VPTFLPEHYPRPPRSEAILNTDPASFSRISIELRDKRAEVEGLVRERTGCALQLWSEAQTWNAPINAQVDIRLRIDIGPYGTNIAERDVVYGILQRLNHHILDFGPPRLTQRLLVLVDAEKAVEDGLLALHLLRIKRGCSHCNEALAADLNNDWSDEGITDEE
jgi:hypothetical protein